MFKRILTHSIVQLFTYQIVTQLIGLVVVLNLQRPVRMQIVGFYVLFLIVLGLVGWWMDRRLQKGLGKIVSVAILGVLAAYGLRLIDIHMHNARFGYDVAIGWFGDEWTHSWIYLFPALLIGEALFGWTQNWSWRKWIPAITGVLALLVGPLVYLLRPLPGPDNPASVQSTSPDHPNVILILADDLGYGDLSLYGNSLIQTPNIDAIGRNGVTFTRGYASAPLCAPSRAGLLTGRYQQRFGFEGLPERIQVHPRFRISGFEAEGHEDDRVPWYQMTPVWKAGLPSSETTIAEVLQSQGYATGVIGKWHLGALPRYRPDQNGFDYHLGFYNAASMFAEPGASGIVESRRPNFMNRLVWQLTYQLFENGRRIVDEKRYQTSLFAERAVQFIEENQANRFFLYAAFNAPHTPFQAPQTYYDQLTHIEDHNRRVYYAMILALDDAVGMITSKVRELGLEENTLIYFASDNGGATYTGAPDNGPFAGGKFSLFEGGVAVPFMMQWKGHIPDSMLFEHPVSLLDVFPTTTAATGISLPESVSLDGTDLMPFLVDSLTRAPHQMLFWRNHHNLAVRVGDYKLQQNTRQDRSWLFDLQADAGETSNLIEQDTRHRIALEAELEKWDAGLMRPRWRNGLNLNSEFHDESFLFGL